MIKDNFRYKNIKKRTIKHGNIVKVKKNQNSPKFIIGYCLNIFERQLIAYTTDHLESLYMEETFQIIREWIEQNLRDKLNLKHFKQLFGKGDSKEAQVRNSINRKILYKYLADNALDLVANNKKLGNPLSYLICLEKLTSRLGNQKLVYKMQFK